MRKPNIAILGATGVVGREITKIVDELGVEFNEIKFLSSAKSAGKKIDFKGKTYTVEEAKPESFDGVNIVMASAGGATSQKFAPEIVKRGGVLIDNSSAFFNRQVFFCANSSLFILRILFHRFHMNTHMSILSKFFF